MLILNSDNRDPQDPDHRDDITPEQASYRQDIEQDKREVIDHWKRDRGEKFTVGFQNIPQCVWDRIFGKRRRTA